MNKLLNKKLDNMLVNVGDMAFKARVRTVIDYLDPQPNERILDCGCGEGFYLKILEKLYPQVKFLGVDYDKKILARAKKEVSSRTKLIKANIYQLPFKENYFDKIILSEVLEHLDKDQEALYLIRKTLKNGVLIITVPCANYPFLWDPLNKFLEIFFNTHIKSGFWAGIWNMHSRLYYYEDLVNLCLKTNLKIVKSDFLTHYCFPFNHLFLYGFKQVLNTGFLPEDLSLSADKFTWEESKSNNQLNIVKLGYQFLNWLDSFNNRQFSSKDACVDIAIKATKD